MREYRMERVAKKSERAYTRTEQSGSYTTQQNLFVSEQYSIESVPVWTKSLDSQPWIVSDEFRPSMSHRRPTIGAEAA